MKPSPRPVGSQVRQSPDLLRLAACVVVGGGLSAGGAQAQEPGVGRAITLSASAEAQLSYVVDSRKGGLRGGDFVSELRPTLQLNSRMGRLVGSLNYGLGLLHHSEPFEGDRVQNQLNAQFSAEAVERWLYVDGSASIVQQPLSAFGTQSVAGSSQFNPNVIEVGTVSLSPSVRGVFGSAVSYEARLNATATNGRRSIAADSSQTGGYFTLSSAFGGAPIGWSLVARSQLNDFRAGRQTQSDRYTAGLSFNPDADLSLAWRGTYEALKVVDLLKGSYYYGGGGLTWRPSPRTRVQVDADGLYFGSAYRVLLEHRLASSSVQWSSTRDTASGSDPATAGPRLTAYQLWFNQFATIQPDPALRDVLVRDFLLATGQDPNSVVAGGYVNSSVTVLERHQLTLAYSSTRLAGSLQVFATKSTSIEAAATGLAADGPSQWGYLGAASYRLSPTATLALTGSRSLTRSTASQSGNELKSVTLSLSDQVARRTFATLRARYSVFNSTTEPYREAAVVASLSQRF